MANQSLRNKNPHWKSMQIFAYVILIEQIWHQWQSMFPCESVADKDKETVSGQNRYADFKFINWRMISVRLRQKYNLLKEKSLSSTDQNSALQSLLTSRLRPASIQV